jgi:GWxTD domain-containing protein
VQFWERRDPTPGTARNEFKEEHYRRIAYANTHFGSKIPGSLTARGEIYIKFGPPDEIAHGDRRARQATSFVSSISKPPTQVWIYESPHSVRRFKFVDNCECGEYELVKEPPLYQDIWP